VAPVRNTQQVHLMPLRERCVALRPLAAIDEKFARSNFGKPKRGLIQLARELMKRVGLELHIISQTNSPCFVL
jgi:hypothetical protein